MRDTPKHTGTPSTEPLVYETRTHGQAVVVRCRGAFSLANHTRLGELGEEIRRSDGSRVILDLRDVAYMDSVGVGTIALVVKDAQARGWTLAVVPTPEIHTLMRASRLEGLVEFASSPEAALGS